MKTPFTPEQFLEVFKEYNTSVWPMQIVFYLLGLTAILLILKRTNISDKIVCLVLAVFWIWIGVVYHLLFFTTINKAAYIFGPVFILQGILFLLYGLVKPSLSFRFGNDLYGYAGVLFLVYGLIVYPVLGSFLGHQYPYSPTFGLPCPTVIFTFGILMLTDKKIPFPLLIIPLLWSLIGFSAALSFGILEDTGLLITGILGTGLLVLRNRKYRSDSRIG
jgi:hypothetical protein